MTLRDRLFLAAVGILLAATLYALDRPAVHPPMPWISGVAPASPAASPSVPAE